ncbi:N-6 DNA methylase [Halanaerobium salsuginis]|uniref:Type I restriction enzyme R protein N terminus (HSDR_N) n=1 Tax=Halanaerobium salsuginis TaxID=29563 RepID=A0A1I4KN47_9FIRM|nr:N-6 DNA methylase [Halanaerobium salsuginis]SFL79966.1 Type I restriction enzyme R protein N terminus (HSDR_N) [Halanaerobium salsuginis]
MSEKIVSESDVEYKVITPILTQLGYDTDYFRYKVPVTFSQGHEKVTKEADVVIYDEYNEPVLVVESKKPTKKIEDYIEQLDSYAYGLKSKYGFISNGKKFILRAYLAGNKRINLVKDRVENIDIDSIKEILTDSSKMEKSEEEAISKKMIDRQSDDFAKVLKKIHQDIRNIDKLDPTGAFDAWSKLLFMKIHEEKYTKRTGNVRFSYEKFVEQKEVDREKTFIENTFNETKESFPKVFEDQNESIGLSIEAIERILKRLDGFNILDLPFDIKGKAFEIFLSSTFRGKGLGQFFTPRKIVNFMVKLVDFKIDDVVLDPACGTGGFLIGAFNKIMDIIDKTPKSYFSQFNTTKEAYIETIKKNNILGIDAEPRAAKTAKMNMIMWGDGERVYRGNGLDNKTKSNIEYPFEENGIDVILANPPFGSKEENDDILNKYELSDVKNLTECLFIEKSIKYLRPEGTLAIVIPDSILGSKSLKGVRDFIEENTIIKAIISLPNYTFRQSGVQTINSSILVVEKLPEDYFKEKERLEDELKKVQDKKIKDELKKLKDNFNDYYIYMGVAENIGYDSKGKSIPGENDLDRILKYYKGKPNLDNEEDVFRYQFDSNNFLIHKSKVSNRFDSRYYWFLDILNNKDFSRVPLKEYIKVRSVRIDPTDKPEELFSILSVTNSHGVILDEDDPKKFEVYGSEFNQKYKKVKAGDIVYNPYRINVGSIGIVPDEYDDYLVSPAYNVFETKNGLNNEYLLSIFKHPFYKLYIDVLATGSIRKNFSLKYLKQLQIPDAFLKEDVEDIMEVFKEIKKIQDQLKIKKEKLKYVVGDYLN